MNDIADGKYIGRVVDVNYTTSKAGNPMVVIEWDIDGRLRRRSYHVTVNRDGSRNERNIRTLQSVFNGWDGQSADWFEEHLGECLQVAAQLVILHEEWNGRSMPSIKYVNRLPEGNIADAAVTSPTAAGAVPPPPTSRPVAKKPEGRLPDVIEPELASVWNAYVALHPERDYPALEAGWFALLDQTIIPRKDQDQLDEFEWSIVIAALREEAKAAEGKEAA